jgi:hypothetical protein
MKSLLLLLFTVIVNQMIAQDFFLAKNQFTTPFNSPSANKLVLDIFYENKYFISEWNNKGISISYNKNKSSIYAQFLRKGNSKYSDNIFKLIYSHQLSPKLRISIGNNTLTVQQQEYKTSIKPLLPFINISVKPIETIAVMLSAQTYQRSILPNRIDLIVSKEFSEKTSLLIGARFSNNYPFRFETGVKYSIVNNLDLELNINTGVSPAQFGIRYTYKQKTIVLSNQFHEQLGQSINAQIQFVLL